MDDNSRTLYCGNLSDKVTEDILYELFLQGGPIQKISIPKDRDGRQRPFGFVTYKHKNSVEYALHLFDGTTLYNRPINMQLRNSSESHQAEPSVNPVRNLNHLLELGQQMILGIYPPQIGDVAFDPNISPQDAPGYLRQMDANSGNDDRNRRNHPYQRNRDKNQDRDRDRNQDRDRNRERDRDRNREVERDGERNRERNHNDNYRDERSYYNRDNNYRSNGYSRYNDHRKKWTYH